MAQNLSSAAVVIGALRVKIRSKNIIFEDIFIVKYSNAHFCLNEHKLLVSKIP